MFVDKLNSIFNRKCCAGGGVLHHVTDNIVTLRAARADEDEGKQRKMYQQACRLLSKNHADKVLIVNTSADDLPALLKDDLVNGMVINSSGNASIESYTSYHAPSLDVVLSVCRSAQSWLSAGDAGQVVVLHCTLGHTALIVACLLLYLRVWDPESPSDVHSKHGELLRVLSEGRDGGDFPYLQLRFLDEFIRYLTSFPSNSALLANAKLRIGQKRMLRGIVLRRAPKRLTPLHTLFDGSVSVNQTEVEWLMSSFGQLIEIAPHLQLPPGCVSGNGLRQSDRNDNTRATNSVRRTTNTAPDRADDRRRDRGRERWNVRDDDRPPERPSERNESLEDKYRALYINRTREATANGNARNGTATADLDSDRGALLGNELTKTHEGPINGHSEPVGRSSSRDDRNGSISQQSGLPQTDDGTARDIDTHTNTDTHTPRTSPSPQPQSQSHTPPTRAGTNGSGSSTGASRRQRYGHSSEGVRRERCALGERCPCVFTPVCMVMEGNELKSSSLIGGVCKTNMNHGGTKDVVIGLDVAVQGNVTVRLYHAQTAPTPNRKLCEVSVDVGLIPQDVERPTITFPQHEMLFEKQMDFKPNFSITLIFGEVGDLEKRDDPAIQHVSCRHVKTTGNLYGTDPSDTVNNKTRTNTQRSPSPDRSGDLSDDSTTPDDNWSGSHPNDVGRVDDRTIRQIRDMIEGRTMSVRTGFTDPFTHPSQPWVLLSNSSPLRATPRTDSRVRSRTDHATPDRPRTRDHPHRPENSGSRSSTSTSSPALNGAPTDLSARDMPELMADESDGDYAVRLQAYFDYEERRMRWLQTRVQSETSPRAQSQRNIPVPIEVQPISPTTELVDGSVNDANNTHDAASDARLAATMQASFANEYLPDDQNARWVIIAHSLPVVPYTVNTFKTQEELAEVATEDIECQVCKSEFEEGESLKIMPCIHRYHEQCISKWLWLRGTCPICMYHLDNVLKEPSQLFTT